MLQNLAQITSVESRGGWLALSGIGAGSGSRGTRPRCRILLCAHPHVRPHHSDGSSFARMSWASLSTARILASAAAGRLGT